MFTQTTLENPTPIVYPIDKRFSYKDDAHENGHENDNENENDGLVDDALEPLDDPYLDDLRDEIFSIVRYIQDPEHPHTLEELRIVQKKDINVFFDSDIGSLNPFYHGSSDQPILHCSLQFTPTIPHCSLSSFIGLCIRTAILKLHPDIKLTLLITPGSHLQDFQLNKQLNDKERCCAALENPSIRENVQELISSRTFE